MKSSRVIPISLETALMCKHQRAKSVEKSVGEETEEGNDAERAQADTNPGQSPDRARDCFSVPAYERDHALVLDLMEFFCYGIKVFTTPKYSIPVFTSLGG